MPTNQPLKLLAEESGEVGGAFLFDEFDAVGELQVPELVVQILPDALDGVVGIGDVSRFIGDIVAWLEPVRLLQLETIAVLAPEVELGLRIGSALGLDGHEFQFERSLIVLFGYGKDFDLLDHALLIGVEWRQAIEKIPQNLVRGRVPKFDERIEVFELFNCSISVHPFLRFVHDDNRLALAKRLEVG